MEVLCSLWATFGYQLAKANVIPVAVQVAAPARPNAFGTRGTTDIELAGLMIGYEVHPSHASKRSDP